MYPLSLLLVCHAEGTETLLVISETPSSDKEMIKRIWGRDEGAAWGVWARSSVLGTLGKTCKRNLSGPGTQERGMGWR